MALQKFHRTELCKVFFILSYKMKTGGFVWKVLVLLVDDKETLKMVSQENPAL